MAARPQVRWALGWLTLLLTGLYVALRFNVATDISTFMPQGGEPRVAMLTRHMADSEMSRTVVLLVSGADDARAAAASRAFETALRDEPRVRAGLARLEGGPPEGTERAIYELYHPRRFSFLAGSEKDAAVRLSPVGLKEAANALKRRLSQPMSPLVSRLANSDPLLSIVRLFEGLEDTYGRQLRVVDGRFMTREGSGAVLFLTTASSAFDARAQAPIVAGVEAAFGEVNRQFGGKLRLEQSGVNRIAVQTEQAIKADIQRVTTLSVLCLVGVLVALFRSLRLAALASIPIGCGVLGGTAACLLAFGHVHGITLAFGASLIGVAIDYVVHLYCHHAVAPEPGGATATLARIAPSLRTGAATTLVGFVALAFSGFPGLVEVSLFASAGILAALLSTHLLLPRLIPPHPRAVRFRERVVAGLETVLVRLAAHRRKLYLLPVAALVYTGLGLSRVTLDDDLMRLGRVQGPYLEEDARVRQRVARFDQSRFVVALGETEEQALQANDRVAVALNQAVAGGALGAFRNVAALLPSAQQQHQIAGRVRERLGDGSVLVQAFAAEGFRPEAFGPLRDDLKQPPPSPLTFSELATSPLGAAVRSFRIALGDRVGFLTFLSDVKDPQALSTSLSGLRDVLFVDQRRQMRSAYAAYQRKTVELIVVGLLGVCALLAWRYRRARTVAAALGPSLLAVGVTVGTLGFIGHGLNLVSLTGLLMVVSMGVDYGVFLVDANALGAKHTRAALLSICVAALSTIFGFGLLALSEHPMLATIGLTAWVGILSCLVLAPTALVLTERSRLASTDVHIERN